MELRQLRYLDAVARRRSFTQAALDLHLAQSALSQQVGRLERELGVELLRRTTRRVEVTEVGELVLARAEADLLEGLEGVPLFEEELVIIAPLDHPLARTKRVRVERLGGEPLVTYAPGSALREALLALAPGGRVVAEADELETVREL